MLTVERLKELLHYDPETGEFVWKISRGGKRIGDLAGSIHKGHGYHQLRLDDHLYLSHRLAWLYMTGQWPKNEIDHINGVRIDNRFVNLREATRFQNFANRPKYACNKTGYKGVNWHKRDKVWEAHIRTGNGRKTYLGRFSTPEAASNAYEDASQKFHGEFCHSLGVSAKNR